MPHPQNRREFCIITSGLPHAGNERASSTEVNSISALATRFHVDNSYVARTLRLASLAQDLVEKIVEGSEPNSLSLRRLMKGFPISWDEQRAEVGARWCHHWLHDGHAVLRSPSLMPTPDGR